MSQAKSEKAPELIRMKKFVEARELIRAKKFVEARTILQTLDDPMATEWINKIDRILTTKPLISANKPRHSSNLRGLLFISILTIVIVAAVGAVLLIASTRNNDDEQSKTELVILSCLENGTRNTREACTEMAQTIAQFENDQIAACYLNHRSEFARFNICMREVWQVYDAFVETMTLDCSEAHLLLIGKNEEECLEMSEILVSAYGPEIASCYSSYKSQSADRELCTEIWHGLENTFLNLVLSCMINYSENRTCLRTSDCNIPSDVSGVSDVCMQTTWNIIEQNYTVAEQCGQSIPLDWRVNSPTEMQESIASNFLPVVTCLEERGYTLAVLNTAAGEGSLTPTTSP